MDPHLPWIDSPEEGNGKGMPSRYTIPLFIWTLYEASSAFSSSVIRF
jgi:hypothetical protein